MSVGAHRVMIRGVSSNVTSVLELSFKEYKNVQPEKVFENLVYRNILELCSKVINVGCDTFGNPIFQKGLQN